MHVNPPATPAGSFVSGTPRHGPGRWPSSSPGTIWTAWAALAIADTGTLLDAMDVAGAVSLDGFARDVLAHVDAVLAIDLNASQGNPVVVTGVAGVAAEERVVSVANFEILPLAAALDYLRIVLATALGAASERTVKSLDPLWSGLPSGLVPEGGTVHAGLTYLSLAAQSLAVEARLLAATVSFELASAPASLDGTGEPASREPASRGNGDVDRP